MWTEVFWTCLQIFSHYPKLYVISVFAKKVHFLPPKHAFQTNSSNIIGRNHSMVIPLLANQDLTPILVKGDNQSKTDSSATRRLFAIFLFRQLAPSLALHLLVELPCKVGLGFGACDRVTLLPLCKKAQNKSSNAFTSVLHRLTKTRITPSSYHILRFTIITSTIYSMKSKTQFQSEWISWKG